VDFSLKKITHILLILHIITKFEKIMRDHIFKISGSVAWEVGEISTLNFDTE
jgi:hypothetical protein